MEQIVLQSSLTTIRTRECVSVNETRRSIDFVASESFERLMML